MVNEDLVLVYRLVVLHDENRTVPALQPVGDRLQSVEVDDGAGSPIFGMNSLHVLEKRKRPHGLVWLGLGGLGVRLNRLGFDWLGYLGLCGWSWAGFLGCSWHLF